MFGGSAYEFALTKYFSFAFFLFIPFAMQLSLFHSGYVIKPLQPDSAICGASPFTGNLLIFPLARFFVFSFHLLCSSVFLRLNYVFL